MRRSILARNLRWNLLLILLAAISVAGCGGHSSSAGEQTVKVRYASQISFGDSLSDVGSYAVGTVKALGGGQFNINGAINEFLTGKNWTTLMAAQFGLPAPCPAQTGLNGDAALGFNVAVVNFSACTGYAQGGARVTNPVGSGNVLTGSSLGALTVPVATQIQNHLSKVGGVFAGDEIVFFMAGGNDVLAALSALSSGATAAGKTAYGNALVAALAAGATDPVAAAQSIGLALQTEAARNGSSDSSITAVAIAAAVAAGNSAAASATINGPLILAAQAAASTAAQAYFSANAAAGVTTVATAASELAVLVKVELLAKGATHVVVVNIPDLASTPYALEQSAAVQTLVAQMVSTFNSTLASGVSGDSKIVLVDAYAVNHDQIVNPAPYGLTNVSTRACDVKDLAKNPLASSLVCNAGNLISGDVTHYLFADDVHPTPFGYLLLARYVSERLVVAGWL